jgi:hypothetical protein
MSGLEGKTRPPVLGCIYPFIAMNSSHLLPAKTTPGREGKADRIRSLAGFGRLFRVIMVGCAIPIITQLSAFGGPDEEAIAVSAKTSPDYIRQRLSDGSFQPESFAFAKGGALKNTEAGTTDMLDFIEVAKTIARPLGQQGYLPAKDAKTTRLLIMVYWGTTRTPVNPTNSVSSQNLASATAAAFSANHVQTVRYNPSDSMAPQQVSMAPTTASNYSIQTPEQIDADNAMTGALAAAAAEDNSRIQLDGQNARMLGYDSLWDATLDSNGTALEYRRQDLLSELEAHRYFVVLMAYDFQELWKHKKARLLWEARFSVRERGDDFSKELAGMAEGASRYFGQDSGKLVRTPLREGRVDLGAIKIVP